MKSTFERVPLGAGWLDANFPGWAQRVQMRRLFAGCCRHCILGQLWGEYHLALLALGQSDRWAVDMGFNGPTSETVLLTYNWRLEVGRRQEGGGREQEAA
jgi:hypothetical protein